MKNAVTNSYKPSSVKERLGIVLVGLLGSRVINHLFDEVLYPFVLCKIGSVFGGVIMTLGSLLVCLLMLKFYDWAKKDWLCVETVKEAKEGTKSRFIVWVLGQRDAVSFLILSTVTDPFVTTIAMRKGAWQFNGLSKRDWKIFLGSVLIGNVLWTILLSLGIWVFTLVWPWLKPIWDPVWIFLVSIGHKLYETLTPALF